MAKAAFTFGRMNPPHIGHELVVEAVRKAGGRNSFLFTSHSNDTKKNPLNYRKKITYLRKMFGKKIKIVDDLSIRDVHAALEYLSDKGFTELRMVVGVSGMSASKLRKIVAAGDFDAFQVGMPRTILPKDQKKLYNDLRVGMGLNEDTETYWFDHDEFVLFEKMYNLSEDKDILKHVTDFIS